MCRSRCCSRRLASLHGLPIEQCPSFERLLRPLLLSTSMGIIQMLKKLILSTAMLGGLVVAGCADGNLIGGNMMTTSAVPTTPAVDPVCVQLSSQIDTLRKDGIAEKIEKAAAKKHKMTSAELAKASELNKANAEFQAKCSTVPKSALQTADATPAAATKAEAVKTVAKAETAATPKP